MPASRGDVRALHIHEILSAVFQELDKASLASCARVCHDWEPLASRTLWRDLSDDKEGLSALVNLLGDVNQDLHELVCTWILSCVDGPPFIVSLWLVRP